MTAQKSPLSEKKNDFIGYDMSSKQTMLPNNVGYDEMYTHKVQKHFFFFIVFSKRMEEKK